LAVRDSSLLTPNPDQPASSVQSNPVGTKDAPIDGKDGKPHDGPFVETEAERDRKKAKGAADEEPAAMPSTGQAKEQTTVRQSNDGVMDDPNRVGPKDGTRGTEGGMSEKFMENKAGEEKKPGPPKEAPPLPHSEQEMMKDPQGKDVEDILEEEKNLLEVGNSSAFGFQDLTDEFWQKPTDLPSKPHDIPQAENPSFPKDDNLPPVAGSPAHIPKQPSLPDENGVIQPLHSLLLSFTMILFSEIGDKTFIVAALMAMRHPRMVVFTSAFSAMIVMTVLSAVLGHAVPTLIPKSVTNFLAAALFLVFGVKMLLEARQISPDEGVSEEMKEVEMELEEKEHQQQRRMGRRRSSVSPYILESGRGVRQSRSGTTRLPSPPESPSSSSSRDHSPSRQSFLSNALIGINNLLSLLLSPAWVQTFVMTFLGEWGDRSQIATIAMAAGQDYWWVVAGALGGHFICTAAAVVGGAAIAGKVSLRVGESITTNFMIQRLTSYQSPWAAPLPFLYLASFICSKRYINRMTTLPQLRPRQRRVTKSNAFRCAAARQ
jgi:Ca2+/H+ antiporter, TMEM165/GDT1 family